MGEFDIGLIVAIVLGLALILFIFQNIYLSAKNRELDLMLKMRDADIAELRAKMSDKQSHASGEILKILSDMNSGGSLLRVERVNPDHVFQWHPSDRG